MALPFDEWLSEVVADPISSDPLAPIDWEAHANMWGFPLSAEQARGLKVGDVVAFVEAVEQARSEQILRDHGGNPMQMYVWHDWQASKLCFSLVSASHGYLPFGSGIQASASLEQVAESFLTDPYLDGIPLSEFTEIPLSECAESEDVVFNPPPLLVSARHLPLG